MMLVGAMGGFAVWFHTGNLFFGLLIGMIFGGLLALLHGCITIALRADQVVSGLAVTFLRTGLSSILGAPYVGKRVPVPLNITVPLLKHVELQQVLLVIFGLVFALLVWYYVNPTRPGLNPALRRRISFCCRFTWAEHPAHPIYLRGVWRG